MQFNIRWFGFQALKFLKRKDLLIRPCSTGKPNTLPKYTVNFILPSGEKISGHAKDGDTLLDVVINNNIDIDGFGACEGTLSCSTCHLIFDQKDFDALKPKPTPEELDMLDLAYDLTDTSRLGCQIPVSKELDGVTVKLPKSVFDNRTK